MRTQLSNLWTVCDPDSPVPAGEHMHRCHSCNTAWTHGNDLPDSRLTTAQFNKAHSCPNCGREETYKYRVNENDLREAAAEIGAPNPAAFAHMVADRFNHAWRTEAD